MQSGKYRFELENAAYATSQIRQEITALLRRFFKGEAIEHAEIGNGYVRLESENLKVVLTYDEKDLTFCRIGWRWRWLCAAVALRCRVLKLGPQFKVNFSEDVLKQIDQIPLGIAGVANDGTSLMTGIARERIVHAIGLFQSDPSLYEITPIGVREYDVRETRIVNVRARIKIGTRNSILIKSVVFPPTVIDEGRT